MRVAAAVGITNDVIDRVHALESAGVDSIVVDTAHGHSKGVGDVVKKIKSKFSNLDLVVGNIATSEAAKYLIKIGADAVKVELALVQYAPQGLLQGLDTHNSQQF